MRSRSYPMSLRLVMTAMNAAVYAGIGALWTAFPLLIFGVRFWPQVFVPATFSVLFGPWVGGVGAAIGIFLADVIYGHHDALLSLLVGVPSNFVGFFIIGWLPNHDFRPLVRRLLLSLSLIIQPAYALALVYSLYALFGAAALGSSTSYLGFAGLVVVFAVIALFVLRNRWADFEVAASIGLARHRNNWPRAGGLQRDLRSSASTRSWNQTFDRRFHLLSCSLELLHRDSIHGHIDPARSLRLPSGVSKPSRNATPFTAPLVTSGEALASYGSSMPGWYLELF